MMIIIYFSIKFGQISVPTNPLLVPGLQTDLGGGLCHP